MIYVNNLFNKDLQYFRRIITICQLCIFSPLSTVLICVCLSSAGDLKTPQHWAGHGVIVHLRALVWAGNQPWSSVISYQGAAQSHGYTKGKWDIFYIHYFFLDRHVQQARTSVMVRCSYASDMVWSCPCWCQNESYCQVSCEFLVNVINFAHNVAQFRKSTSLRVLN